MQPELKIPKNISPIAKTVEVKNRELAEILAQQKHKKSPYKKWVQTNISTEACEADDWLISHSPAAYRIFKFLIANMDRYNAIICSYKVMQEKFGYSQATVKRAIKLLKEHKFIGVAKSGTSNVYMINKKLYWNSWGTNYAHAEFEAKVIISASEQEKEFQEEIELDVKKRQEVVTKRKKENILQSFS